MDGRAQPVGKLALSPHPLLQQQQQLQKQEQEQQEQQAVSAAFQPDMASIMRQLAQAQQVRQCIPCLCYNRLQQKGFIKRDRPDCGKGACPSSDCPIALQTKIEAVFLDGKCLEPIRQM